MNKDVRKAGEEHYSSEKVKGKLHAPDKKEKNTKRSIFNEIEEDEEIDYRSLIKKEDSILSYYDDGDEDDFDDDEGFDEDDDEYEEDDEDYDDEDDEDL